MNYMKDFNLVFVTSIIFEDKSYLVDEFEFKSAKNRIY